MRHLLIILLQFFLVACNNDADRFDKNYYEKITGITFSDDYKVLETFDNNEYITATAFKLDNPALVKFIQDNHLDTLRDSHDFHLMSADFFKHYIPEYKKNHNLFITQKGKGTSSSFYFVDLTENKLWIEIRYPDASGK